MLFNQIILLGFSCLWRDNTRNRLIKYTVLIYFVYICIILAFVKFKDVSVR